METAGFVSGALWAIGAVECQIHEHPLLRIPLTIRLKGARMETWSMILAGIGVFGCIGMVVIVVRWLWMLWSGIVAKRVDAALARERALAAEREQAARDCNAEWREAFMRSHVEAVSRVAAQGLGAMLQSNLALLHSLQSQHSQPHHEFIEQEVTPRLPSIPRLDDSTIAPKRSLLRRILGLRS